MSAGDFLDALAWALLLGSLVGVAVCANWPKIQGWLALLDDCAESIVDAWGFGDWSDDAQEPLNWETFPEWRELVESGKARRLTDGPRPIDRRSA